MKPLSRYITKGRACIAACSLVLPVVAVIASPHAGAQSPVTPQQPTVTVSASSTATVANDRLQAWLRAEAENVSPAAASGQVNATVAKALASARAISGIKVATSGYSTQQIVEKGKPSRWRVAQTITLDAADFTAASALITKLQDDDGLLLSGLAFSLAERTRRDAEDGVTQQAIRSWQSRAQQAAQGLGFGSWRPGHVTVQTSDGGRPYPMLRAQASSSVAGGAPVALEAGSTDVTVTVSGEAILDAAKPPRDKGP